MKIFPRYRTPSLSTVLGITKATKRVKKATGITGMLKPFRALKNLERRVKRRAGYYSAPMKFIRAVAPRKKKK